MRRIAVLALSLTSLPAILFAGSNAASAGGPPIPIIGDGHKDRVCLVWEGGNSAPSADQSTPVLGDYCVTY